MNTTFEFDKTKISIVKLTEQKSDFAFWQTQSYESRLMMLEKLRQTYNLGKYGTGQEFERVYRITQRLKTPILALFMEALKKKII